MSTNVGGIPEILPKDMLILSEPNSTDLIKKIEFSLKTYNNFSQSEFNQRVARYYNWRDIAKRTEKVYMKVLKIPKARVYEYYKNLLENQDS